MEGPWENYSDPDALDGPWKNYDAAGARVQETVSDVVSGGYIGPPKPGMKGRSFYPKQPDKYQQVGADMLKAEASGVTKGVAGLIGLPELIGRVGSYGIDQAVQAVVGAARPEQKPMFHLPSTEDVTKFIEGYTGPLYKPKTLPGKAVGTVSEFLPGGVLARGGIVGNAMRYGVVPGLASEAAGQATEGTAYEKPARIGAGLTAAAVMALLSRGGTAANAVRGQLPEGITPQMVDQAGALVQRAADQGITLSWPEALSQVAGRHVLTNLLRHLEGAPQTEARMAEFFGQRPAQVERAGRDAFDALSPANPNPSTIGPAAGRVAEEAVNDVRGAINAASEPHYTAAAPQIMDAATMARIRNAPGWQEARNAVRNDPQLARYVQGLPDDSIGFLNEVKKYLDAAAENASAPVNAQRNMQRSAGYDVDARLVRDSARRASPEYATALDIQARGREQFLQPLLDGPIGKLASRDPTTKAAIDALFPSNPLPNSAGEIARTVGELARRSPRVAGDLVRAHVESVFNEATQALQSGANQAGGAKFASTLVGNPQQRANLQAAVEALPHGHDRWQGFERLLDVLEATRPRQNIGSRTAYNAELLKQQSASGVIGETAKATANPLRGVQFLADKYERYRLGRNLNELAELMTNPASINQLRAIARMPANSSRLPMLVYRTLVASQSANREPVQKPR